MSPLKRLADARAQQRQRAVMRNYLTWFPAEPLYAGAPIVMVTVRLLAMLASVSPSYAAI
jgi:hypothetical protein